MGRKKINNLVRCKECKNLHNCRQPDGKINSRRLFCSRSCAMKYTGRTRKQPIRTEEWKRRISLAQKGERGNNWKGGTTSINKLIRRSGEFKQWRKAVFKRDGWTCQECKRIGGELHPHHIKPFSTHVELRFDINNGQTLCKECHIKTDSWAVNKRFLN